MKTTGSPNLNKSLESNDNFTAFLKVLKSDGIAFTINKLAVIKQDELKKYYKTLFVLELDTSFLTLGQFIDKLEHSDLLLEVQSLDVSRIGRELKKCTVKIEFYGYVMRKPS